MSLKDPKLEEKNEVVIHGTILADEFRDRVTGKKIDPLGGSVTIDEIDSENQPAGKAILSDGHGGAEWGDVEGMEVVELSSLSGTLTNEQYQKVSGDNCLIKVSTQYLRKEFHASTLITYKAFPRDGTNSSLIIESVEITKSTKEWELKSGTYPFGIIDSDVTVEIESDYSNDDYNARTNYATAISLQEFIKNCEDGIYTNAGTIAKINNLISKKAFRIILIGNDHEKLVYDDTTNAKTTWQFLDMPEHNVRLGLPINILDWTSGSGKAYINEYLDGTNTAQMQLYPSNMDGLLSAQGLLQSLHVIFEELPDTLKRHIKTVRRYTYRKRNTMSVAADGGAESNSGQMCDFACNLFHLAGTDNGTYGQSGEGSDSAYSYFNSNARRIRFYNGTATSYWTASAYTSNAHYWYSVNGTGIASANSTSDAIGVAPAFCI